MISNTYINILDYVGHSHKQDFTAKSGFPEDHQSVFYCFSMTMLAVVDEPSLLTLSGEHVMLFHVEQEGLSVAFCKYALFNDLFSTSHSFMKD